MNQKAIPQYWRKNLNKLAMIIWSMIRIVLNAALPDDRCLQG